MWKEECVSLRDSAAWGTWDHFGISWPEAWASSGCAGLGTTSQQGVHSGSLSPLGLAGRPAQCLSRWGTPIFTCKNEIYWPQSAQAPHQRLLACKGPQPGLRGASVYPAMWFLRFHVPRLPGCQLKQWWTSGRPSPAPRKALHRTLMELGVGVELCGPPGPGPEPWRGPALCRELRVL